ncbi:MAG: hypothetical protein HOG03_10730 [Desulfobacula sp.]|jgi:hypothetical protein|uniref:hypothetical protein n=1 Tax=Desulfobacula sp. TaxID=2593537 RepID=UPI001DA563EA|nr:hypothetical protein [Desulfobacula sp.]MBT3486440.1 hypothetical protein [Desulfobacula sp.]MBT3805061.1 hypothetical protein [Desulfobacula sp.]MBT4025563.1 hypothetical protein [Desulfobacula sp.]MBT4199709.1 hypothetical protein [Desulfobacula sp.]
MKYTWWLFQIIMTLLSGFFLIFGVDLMTGSYSLNDPFSFIMSFFSASFVILISLTLIISFPIKMIRVYRQINGQNDNKEKPL